MKILRNRICFIEPNMDKKINKKKIKINFYTDRDKKEYTNFLLNEPDANIYHTIECKEIIENIYKFKPHYLIARDDKNKIRAILPFFYLKNFCGKRLDSVPHSIYGGAVGEKVYVEKLVETIFNFNKDLNCRYIIIRQHPDKYSDIFTAKEMKKHENRWTQIVEIKDPELLWNQILKSNRNSIRKAIKNKLHVERSNNIEDLKSFHRMELLTRKKYGISTPSLDFFRLSWKKLHSKGYMELFITKYKQIPISSCLIYIFKNNVILAYANYDNNFLEFRPNNILLWKVIEWCYDKGYKFFNLGATDIDNEGLFFFKSSFNTINIPFAHYYYPADSVILEDTAIGKIGRKSLQNTPIFILRVICPFLLKKFG